MVWKEASGRLGASTALKWARLIHWPIGWQYYWTVDDKSHNLTVNGTRYRWRVFFAKVEAIWHSIARSYWEMSLHTYIIGHYNPSVRIIDLVSHITNVVCVNFIHKWRDLQFEVDFERQIFWETFHGNFYLLSEFLSEICSEEIVEEILFCILFWLYPWLYV